MTMPLHCLHVHPPDSWGATAARLVGALPPSTTHEHWSLPRPHGWDAANLWRLRQRLQANPPAIVQAWGPQALVPVWLASRGLRCRTVAVVERVSAWQRWLLPRFERVIVPGPATRSALRLPASPLPLPAEPIVERPRSAVLAAVGLPSATRFVLVAGAWTTANGLRPALYAFDLVRYVFPDVHLLLAGRGPEERAFRTIATSLASDDQRTHLTAHPVAELLPHALAVWVPNRVDGVELVRMAVAAGVPTVVRARPELSDAGAGQAEVIADAAQLHTEMARRTRSWLLDEPDRTPKRVPVATAWTEWYGQWQ
jgi:glycosyltransferase involved in cell wall biosynthesis